ncbi:MAG: SpoIIE family protein phosphatase [Bacteroidales bacterium]|nr:SpoIIE family protein phosphatase [Bacteroidales bacterium]
MKLIVKLVGAIILSIFTLINVNGQNYNMTIYSTATIGLPNNYVYDIAQDRDGFLWMATSDGLSRYDGVSLVTYTEADSLSSNYVSSLVVDTEGNIWCGHGDGQLSHWNGETFEKIYLDDVSAPIKNMCIDDRGNIWAIEQSKGLFRVSANKEITKFHDRKKFGRQTYNALVAINAYNMLIGTNNGLMLAKFDVDGTINNIETFEQIEYQSVECIKLALDGEHYWIGTEEGRVFKFGLYDGITEIAQCAVKCSPTGETKSAPIRSIYEDPHGYLYVATWGNGVSQLEKIKNTGQYVETLNLNIDNGLGNNFISNIIVDREGIFWFSTYGEGVVSWHNNYFSEYKLSDIGFQRMKIMDGCADSDYIWMALNYGILKMDRQCIMNHEFYDTSHGLPNSPITEIRITDEKDVYVGTEDNGVYLKKNNKKYFQKIYYTSPTKTTDMVNCLVMNGDILYIATQGGLVAYSTTTNQSVVFTTNNGLPHNCVNFVYIDSEGQLWIGPKDSGITKLETDVDISRELPANVTWDIHRLSEDPINVPALTEDSRGRKWLVSANNGILCATNDSVVSITTTDGLEKNFCYDVVTDNQDKVWVCHQPGLSCIDLRSGGIRTFNSSIGFNKEYIHAYADEEGDIWFISRESILHYSAKLDVRSMVAPVLSRTKTIISDESYLPSQEIDLSYPYFRDIDRFEFSFVAVNLRDPKNVKYQYWLQIGEDDTQPKWSASTTQAVKSYDYLPDGNYILHVRAFSPDGIPSQNIVSIPIHIDKPFWKSIFFPIISVILIIYLIRVIVRNRERKIKKREEELEREVQKQTAKLQNQQYVIERKNKDITDSINYANRIQTAILPSRTCLKEYDLADSFLLFRPKDIVSGDCYWVGQFDDHLLICCGDCTGHGVPGAFMSMIITTLINDATRTPENRRPAKLLAKIDMDIKHTLNKNQVVEAQDGMDCAILNINLKTRELVSAGARRPVIIFNKNKFMEIRPTRRSVGERRNGNEYTEETTQLAEGDVIYAFSDGFTDQFNQKEEKYTTGKLKRLLQDIYTLPMYEQQEKLEKEFEDWKGTHEQLDDVIVMGIKLK